MSICTGGNIYKQVLLALYFLKRFEIGVKDWHDNGVMLDVCLFFHKILILF